MRIFPVNLWVTGYKTSGNSPHGQRVDGIPIVARNGGDNLDSFGDWQFMDNLAGTRRDRLRERKDLVSSCLPVVTINDRIHAE